MCICIIYRMIRRMPPHIPSSCESRIKPSHHHSSFCSSCGPDAGKDSNRSYYEDRASSHVKEEEDEEESDLIILKRDYIAEVAPLPRPWRRLCDLNSTSPRTGLCGSDGRI